MQNYNTRDFLMNHQIEEKIPYFGKARLMQLHVSNQKKNIYFIPKEIFHFITAIYILDNNVQNKYILAINGYKKEFDKDFFSRLGENEIRMNLLEDPIFLGNNTNINIEIFTNTEEVQIAHLLIEFGKIQPDLFQSLHRESILLISKQGDTEIHQIRGNTSHIASISVS